MSTNIQGRSLMTTNAINNRCTWKAKSKQRSSGTEQRELFFNASSASHNIYYSQFSGQSRLLQKSTESNKPGKPDKSIWLNVFTQADSLKVSVPSIKSYAKDVCTNIQGRSLISTNEINNRCTWKGKSKQPSRGTEQLSLFINDNKDSHNISYIELSGQSRFLPKSTESNQYKKPGKSIYLNIFGQANSLKVSVSSIKSYTKDVCSNIWVSLADREDPIQVRNSISEIQDLIFGGK